MMRKFKKIDIDKITRILQKFSIEPIEAEEFLISKKLSLLHQKQKAHSY